MAGAGHVSIRMRPERPPRGPKPAYSRAQITEAAIRIADAEGPEAPTMRRIAAGIDVTGMPSGDRRADLTRYAHQVRAMWRRERLCGEHRPRGDRLGRGGPPQRAQRAGIAPRREIAV